MGKHIDYYDYIVYDNAEVVSKACNGQLKTYKKYYWKWKTQ